MFKRVQWWKALLVERGFEQSTKQHRRVPLRPRLLRLESLEHRELLSINAPPTLDPIVTPAWIGEDVGSQTVNLSGITAGDGESQALQVTATSDNPALIPNPTVSYTSPSSTGELTYTPVANQRGTAVITATVRDAGFDGQLGTADDKTFQQTFPVTVNACTNGSFEILDQNGLPQDWSVATSAGGLSVVDASSEPQNVHSGQRALRLERYPDAISPSTGVNRLSTTLLTKVEGGVDFWYKAVSAGPSAVMQICVIPIGASGAENTGSPRAIYTIPMDHVGDGQWHHGWLSYDYTANPLVTKVHFASRLSGDVGVLLLDDMSYLENGVNYPPTLDPIVTPAWIGEGVGPQTVNLSGISTGAGESQTLQVTATSDNPALIPNPTVSYTAPNTTGTLTYTPVANQRGTAVITVTVRDAGFDGQLDTSDDRTFQQTFPVTVNACTNGSFEILDPNGLPQDWSVASTAGGLSVVDASSEPENVHSGQRALRLERYPDAISTWTGVNRRSTALLTKLEGGVDFWYKAVSAGPDAVMKVCVIPIGASGTENTGSPRAEYTIPVEHVGDGQWHHGWLSYDYTANPLVTKVHFASRLSGDVGVLLLDDMSYLENGVDYPPTLDPIVTPAWIDEDVGPQTVNLTGITSGAGENQTLRVTATSDNPALIPDPTVNYTASNTTGTLTYTPVANQRGTAVMTVTVRDAGLDGQLDTADDGIVQRTFPVTVNACTNGSFEILDENGVPVDWRVATSAGGLSVVEASSEPENVHSGQRAVRLEHYVSDGPESGLNRRNYDVLLTKLQGGMEFWYKTVSAGSDAARMTIGVIPIGAENVEDTGSHRTLYHVPAAHIGDGQWHRARLSYDYTDNPLVTKVHFAARLAVDVGVLLLDDLSYLDAVGALPRIRALDLYEDPEQPGTATLRMQLENGGDQPAENVVVTVTPPAGVTLTGQGADPDGTFHVSSLAPGELKWFNWTVTGARTGTSSIDLSVSADGIEPEFVATDRLTLQPRLVLQNYGPVAPVANVGQETRVECVLENTGSAIVQNTTVTFSLPNGQEVTQTVAEILPGQTSTVWTTFTPSIQSAGLEIPLHIENSALAAPLTTTTKLVVVAADQSTCPVLGNDHLRLIFRHNTSGYGPGELQVNDAVDGWQTVAWLPRLSRIVTLTNDVRQEQVVYAQPPQLVGDTLRFVWQAPGLELVVQFQLTGDAKKIRATYELRNTSETESVQLLAFDGPMLYAPNRDEAIFPGLEWLVGDEVSSSTLDIQEGHPHQVRYVVDPQMIAIPAIGIHGEHGTVGLLWDNTPQAGETPRPAAVFASPDRFENQRAHLAGLFLPGVPDYVAEDTREAPTTNPYNLNAGQSLGMACWLYADSSAEDSLAAVDAWIEQYGVPNPSTLPHGTYEDEIEFSMQAYLTSLWNAETQDWWVTRGSQSLSYQDRPRNFVADLIAGEIICPDVATACSARADEVLGLIGGEHRLDAQRFPGRFDTAIANPSKTAQYLAARQDGGWLFDADLEPTTLPFIGYDYYQLGPDNALELGTCARKAYEILRYARISGDWQVYENMLVTLELMEQFTVPRAAQTWEVPVHSPDVLAASDAVDAYLEAYLISGDERWLNDAIAWARRGLPFVYLWDDPNQAFINGASIAVFGASWDKWSWFGKPVQWNGLRFAGALLKLAEYDQSQPWNELALSQIHSAIQQQVQDPTDPDAALWPDSINAITGTHSSWVFSPRQILELVLPLAGHCYAPMTAMVDTTPPVPGGAPRRLHVTAAASDVSATWAATEGGDTNVLNADVTYPSEEQGVMLVSNVTRPTAVYLDGVLLTERADVESGTTSGWRYDARYGYLSIRVAQDGTSHLRVTGASFLPIERVPEVANQVHFEFDESLEGWSAAHAISTLNVSNGILTGSVSSIDPFLTRDSMQLQGDDCPVIRIRMRVTGGTSANGQLFWTNSDSPSFTQSKSISFPLITDGQFHEYQLAVGTHAEWQGKTITRLRLDPFSWSTGTFDIDYILGPQVSFDFEDPAQPLEEWYAAHHIAGMTSTSGILTGNVTGNDPYLIRSGLSFQGTDCPVIEVRIRVTGIPISEPTWRCDLFWAIPGSGFNETKKVRVNVPNDGQFHVLTFNLADCAAKDWWLGQTITQLRIDPGNTDGSVFEIDYIRGWSRS